MRAFDWLVVVVYIGWIVIDGLRRSREHRQGGRLLSGEPLAAVVGGRPVGDGDADERRHDLAVRPDRGTSSGLRFVQMYFGLPLAMVILSLTVVPFFTRARVYTAYEYLERRFDVRVRSLASFLFLAGRALALGVTLSAPAVVMSSVLGWTLPVTVLVICVPMIFYTTIGGVQAVAWTDVKQMFIVVFGMLAAVAILLYGILQHVSLGQALHLAGATGRLQSIDFSFNLTEKYTFWSGMIGGLFLMLSYFGCDQSQVQRYLTAKSIDEARQSLMMSAYVKIPLQLLILVSGVLVFVFYVFYTPPMLFNRAYDAQVASGPQAAEYVALQQEFDAEIAVRRTAAERNDRETFLASDARLKGIRAKAVGVVKEATGDVSYNDVNYVFSDVHHDAAADRPRRADDRGDLCGGDVGQRRRAECPRHGDDHRLLPPAFRQGGVGRALPARVEAGDDCLGTRGLCGRDARRESGVVDRGGQPVRVLLLWLVARRVHPRHPDEARLGDRCVLGAAGRHGRRAPGRVSDALDRVFMAQFDRCHCGR